MSKYAPLYDYLRRKPASGIHMTFTDVERVIGNLLPKSAARPQWWANERSVLARHVQCNAWLDAGYEAFPSLKAEQVTFKRKLREC